MHAVNARQKSVQGLRAVPSLTANGGPVDLAVLALPMAACADAARECVATGVKAAILLRIGLGESGAAGAARQQEITRVARQGDLRLLGPNCIGLVSEPLRVATFATVAGGLAGAGARIDRQPVRRAGLVLSCAAPAARRRDRTMVLDRQ